MLDDLGTVTMIYFAEKRDPEDIGSVYWPHKMETIGKASVLGGFHLLTQGSWHLIHKLKNEEKGCDEVVFNLYVQGNEAGIFNADHGTFLSYFL